MAKSRRRFSGTEKMAILREHLIDKVPVSEVCDKHGVQPTMFYAWQKKLFEEGARVFEQARGTRPLSRVAIAMPSLTNAVRGLSTSNPSMASAVAKWQ